MTKDAETLRRVPQNDNYQHYDSIMDSWVYTDRLFTEPQPCREEDHTTNYMFYNNTPYHQEGPACSPADRMSSEPSETGSSPDLLVMEASQNLVKSESIFSCYQQEALNLNDMMLSHFYPPYVHQTPQPVSSGPDTYNHILDTLLSQTWQADTVCPDTSTEVQSYSDLFPEQPSPVYTDSYTNSPAETFRSDFQFVLEAPLPAQNKSSELPSVYLNRGLFYPISFLGSSTSLSCDQVKTVVMVVFENSKSADTQLSYWSQWHERQPTTKQRVIDVADYNGVFCGIGQVEEVAFNALSFTWNPSEEAKAYVRINCLSTDFSNQKGVKGLPLNLQVDTYDISRGTNRLIHRAACQMKIFSDKGAERKMKDENRRRSRKSRGKNVIVSENDTGRSSGCVGSGSTFLKALDDHVSCPVLFIPKTHLSCGQRLSPPTTPEEKTSLKRPFPDEAHQNDSSPVATKQARREDPQRVLLYVRRGSEEVFESLLLDSPTLKGLKEVLSKQYGLQEDAIWKVYKKCKRGFLVNVDDNIIEYYSNHLPFLIEISEVPSDKFLVTLVEL
ncbi:hypothetical protein DPEC_G00159770 [Dallia pectoralis]|uniref:Uncharacterized protein n=1 Tax=Dallia pectoralis TaxID=75939 RepID=A0ACC2GFR3_DALPE|nr:hypothetical protein DPEC_G00159770 [Dallia pectoralis]